MLWTHLRAYFLQCYTVRTAVVITALLALFMTGSVTHAASGRLQSVPQRAQNTLSPYWAPTVRRWAPQIDKVAHAHGLDPDFIAAVVKAESDGNATGTSRVGAVGLMGVMPNGPGLEWRPSPEQLADPGLNLRWGVGILTEIIRQAGGDVSAALAAYSGGWNNATRTVPRRYADDVLHHYAQAVLARNGLPTDVSARWTIALDMNYGHIPATSPLVLGDYTLPTITESYAPHTIYRYIDDRGRMYTVHGRVVPVALTIPTIAPTPFGGSDDVEDAVGVRLGIMTQKEALGRPSPRVILACLPSISRLRGQQTTRWFAPSSCPDWHR